MLQRTRAPQVVVPFRRFQERFKTPHALASESPARLRRLLASLGLRWRIDGLRKLGLELVTSFGGEIPGDETALRSLPGIGPYAAAAFRSMHLGLPSPIIDGNVVRFYGRMFGFQTDGETRRKPFVGILAARMTPRRGVRAFNYAMIDFTRSICAQRPRCPECPMQALCDYYETAVKRSLE